MREYNLTPIYENVKSYYGKAKIRDYGFGQYELLSYGTVVSVCQNGEVARLGKWSRTTSRHQKEFEKQFGTAQCWFDIRNSSITLHR